MNLPDFVSSHFAHPRGPLGQVAGMMMARRNRERNLWVISLLDLRPTDQVLEIGFGPGWAMEQVAGIVTSGKVAGVDSSRTMLDQAGRRNRAALRAGRISLRQGSESPLPYRDNTFDKAFAVNSFQFWSQPAEGLKALKRVLKPFGRAVIAVQPMWVKTDEAARAVGDDLRRQLEAAGFDRVRLETLALKPLCMGAVGEK
jgi:ubiquinone/menaquinone biosynthesis C-methylase UbiE